MTNKLNAYVEKINAYLAGLFCEPEVEAGIFLNKSMKYSLDCGGKRLRPVLLLEFASLCGLSPECAMSFACSVELIHTYSLIHDDLPCMDDDPLRRGKPSSHVVFGEAGAVLAGDALLNAAFELMLTEADRLPPVNVLSAAAEIARSSGRLGMIAGQAMDITNEKTSKKDATYQYLEKLSAYKTGAIIKGACVAGVKLAGVKDPVKLEAAAEYGRALGLAFQIRDDYLDVYGDEQTLGKATGNDEKQGKVTFADVLGKDGCEKQIQSLTESAVKAVSVFKDNAFLVWLARKMAERSS
jgi:geranylgeranyl diphosphate synthase type II